MSTKKSAPKGSIRPSLAKSFIEETADSMTDIRLEQNFSESVGASRLLIQYSKLPKKYDMPVQLGHVLALMDVLYDMFLESIVLPFRKTQVVS